MRILIVEDDASLARSIELLCARNQHQVYVTDMGGEAIDVAKILGYELIVLDLGLPDMRGDTVVRGIRRAGVTTPVIVLTGEDDLQSKLDLFAAGADDYLTKPFEGAELLARIEALGRRSMGHATADIAIGALTLNTGRKQVSIGSEIVPLTKKEYALFEALALRKGQTINKEGLFAQLYNGLDEPELKIIDVFICKLRQKLAKANNGETYIQTVWGRGYRIADKPPPRQLAAPSGA